MVQLNIRVFFAGLLLRLLRALRHPRGDVEGRGADVDLPQLYVSQQAPLQGQGGPRRWMRNRNPIHVRSKGRR